MKLKFDKAHKSVYSNYTKMYNHWLRIHLLLNNIKLKEQEIKVLLYFMLKGINEDCYTFLIAENIVTDQRQINNIKVHLKKAGLINKIRQRKWEISSKLNIEIKDTLDIAIRLTTNA